MTAGSEDLLGGPAPQVLGALVRRYTHVAPGPSGASGGAACRSASRREPNAPSGSVRCRTSCIWGADQVREKGAVGVADQGGKTPGTVRHSGRGYVREGGGCPVGVMV